MKIKNEKNIEWILNKYLEYSKRSKYYGKPTYEFECWKFGTPGDTIFKAKDKTASGLAKKIIQFLNKIK
jgi:hypothetical protein